MGLSIWHILIVVIVIMLLFGRNRISDIMGDMGKGIHAFKNGLKNEDKPEDPKKEQ